MYTIGITIIVTSVVTGFLFSVVTAAEKNKEYNCFEEVQRLQQDIDFWERYYKDVVTG